MTVGSARYDRKPALDERLGESLGVAHRAARVGLEFRRHRLGEGDRLGGDDVHEGAALGPWKDRLVDDLGERLPGKNEPAPGTAQRLVGRGGHHVGVRHRRGIDTARHQAREVRHIHQERLRRPRRRWSGRRRNR